MCKFSQSVAVAQKRCKIRPRLLWRTNRSRICAFDWYQNHRPWM